MNDCPQHCSNTLFSPCPANDSIPKARTQNHATELVEFVGIESQTDKTSNEYVHILSFRVVELLFVFQVLFMMSDQSNNPLYYYEENSRFLDYQQPVPTSDIEEERNVLVQQQKMAQELLSTLDGWLNHAENALEDLTGQEDMVGSAIIRKCQELADAIGHVANQLEQHTEEERRRLAQACVQDVARCSSSNGGNLLQLQKVRQMQQGSAIMEEDVPPPTVDEMVVALDVANSLLRDVESAFRSIEKDDADEIADVALTLARLFVSSLQSVTETWTPEEIVQAATSANVMSSTDGIAGSSVEIEEVDSLEKDLEPMEESKSPKKRSKNQHLGRRRRVRVLWPPLGPAVASACQWGQDTVLEKPILAVALGITLWPAAIMTAAIGGSLVLVDGCLQDAYNHFQDGPIIQNLETGAGQVVQAGKLGWLCTRLVTKQTLRVVSRQVDRHGGMDKIVQEVGGMVVHHVTHPIETIGMAWDGVAWGLGVITHTIQAMLEDDDEDAERLLQ